MHEPIETTCQFASKKLRKICWQKLSQISVSAPELFCTGSWDDGPNNEVALWRVDSADEEEPKFVKCSAFSYVDDVEDLQ